LIRISKCDSLQTAGGRNILPSCWLNSVVSGGSLLYKTDLYGIMKYHNRIQGTVHICMILQRKELRLQISVCYEEVSRYASIIAGFLE